MMQQKIFKIIILLWSLLAMVSGVFMVLWPKIIVDIYMLEPTGITGWSALQGNFSAMFIALGVTAFLGAWRGEKTWLYCTLLLEGIILVGRLVSFLYHGGISETIVMILIAEVSIAVIILYYLSIYDKQGG